MSRRFSAPSRYVRGFTLLEAIVTLVIVSLLVTVLMQALGQALGIRTRLLRFQGEARVAALQEAWFRETVAGAQVDHPEALGPLEGTPNSLEYATPAPLSAKGFVRVRWWLKSDATGAAVLHYSDPAVADMVVVRGPLRRASFAYLDQEGNWQREWTAEPDDPQPLPQVVRFEAQTEKGSLYWLVPLVTDPVPPESLRLEGTDDGI